jgi:hypothetical protein
MFSRVTAWFFVVLALPLLAACASGDVKAPEANPLPQDTKKGPGLFSGESGNLLAAFRPNTSDGTGGGLGVNGYLWRSALESVSFLPIVQADSGGGVIVTDWYTDPQKPTERFKLNVLILGRSLRPEGVRVTVFKQEKAGDVWKDTAPAPDTASALEETILTNARILRVKEKASE